MLYKVQDSCGWSNLCESCFFDQSFDEVTGINSNKMCVTLCVDSMQKHQHDFGITTSKFYLALAPLCDLTLLKCPKLIGRDVINLFSNGS
ncbi:uncharacterized protein PHALS_14621 [Plasmopara halstedii]|uniref:Uncharacterized protein n=1 Tax=Plasmopara halstedii TaxID=4781 RepID=A0A0P1AN26_PLAHL|nr:uncharacterized protein PHALS_14621 [Plasmopara halstedii]CEG42385.1 hypothetical protein PHALS_14621 [Plasmopara halstedii]|eukprot:XP_024578754.1 hypothetical protein PHALS_14621 [Plasmopara halstedii]